MNKEEKLAKLKDMLDRVDALPDIWEDTNKQGYARLSAVVDKWLLLPDKNVIRILLASLVAHYFTSDPLWIFFVAPPSGSKTEIISTVKDLDLVYLLSDLTPQTFASGLVSKKAEDPSLLTKLKNNILVMKDFTTVLNMRADERAMILSQLREIYDGRYSKAFGTGKKIEWEGRITFIAGVTSIIDTYSNIFQIMGERFITYRIPQASNKEVAKKALNNYGSEKEMRAELKEAMATFFASLKIPDISEIALPHDIMISLASLASFLAICRSGLVRDNWKKEITYIPEPEAPSRLAKQLGTLIKALAVVEQRTTVSWEDYYMTLRIALDVIPSNRMKHLIAMCNEPYLIKTSEIIRKTKYSHSGATTILEDLLALGILKSSDIYDGAPNEWGLSKDTLEYFHEILPKDDPQIYPYFEGSHYLPLLKQMLSGAESEEEKKDELTKMGFPDTD